MGLGMANVLAPCTDSIMGSLPRAKAGVGSAVNDTTRQMGGAVGVAVFGSLMASHFTQRDRPTSSAVDLPARLFAQVRDNVGQAVGVANESPGGAAVRRPDHHGGERQLRERPAPRSGSSPRGITLLAAIGVALFLPARAHDDESENPLEEQEPQPVAVS